MMQQAYILRRKRFLSKMVPSSAALIYAAPKIMRNANIEYPYRQNSDFWYFTGLNEPNSLFILIKHNKNHCRSILFNQMHNNKTNEAYTNLDIEYKAALTCLNIDYVLPWDEIPKQLYLLFNGLSTIYHAQGKYIFADYQLFKALNKLRQGVHKELQAPSIIVDWRSLVNEMRLIKSDEELTIMRRACEITAIAHTCAMRRCRPGMFEYQLEGEVQYEFIRHGARFPSYNIMVGSGKNSCILHYVKNNKKMKNGDLVLIDAGCEYKGYASDVTRTFPINGRFSTEQRAVYNIVLKMLNRSLELYKPGCSIYAVREEIITIMVAGLIQLGIIKGNIEALLAEQAYKKFFMHELSHWIGLDVHDVGDYGTSQKDRILVPGMVLTTEPGIYIPSDEKIVSAYHGIGIRIEETIVITHSGNENLTASAVKQANEIEALMTMEFI
ncbi:Xaa-Pro aminopeptidase [Candidatus Curculioniphilus buchneri]|uniref:Xaa-Pro aminopeptidase n=1 Tax=Candidatus Curculioniphilus buchneri TaxID=690594 RepID=UPI00376F10AC